MVCWRAAQLTNPCAQQINVNPRHARRSIPAEAIKHAVKMQAHLSLNYVRAQSLERAGVAFLAPMRSNSRQDVSKARSGIVKRWADLAKQTAGVSAVEFALILPVLMTILFGIIKFGVTLNADLQLTDGVRAAARQFSISRSSSTPYTLATTALQNATPNLTFARVGGSNGAGAPTFKVNGAACSNDSGCASALSNAMGGTSSLTATYPCDLNIMGVNLVPGCTLSASTSDLVE